MLLAPVNVAGKWHTAEVGTVLVRRGEPLNRVIFLHTGRAEGLVADEQTGALELSGGMLDDLKALGVSGWPIIVFSRTSLGTTDPAVEVDLIIESSVTRDVQIPGVISCNTDADCPDGQTCQFDFQCG